MGLRNTTNTRRASRRAVHCAAPHLDITPNTWHARSAGSEEARLAKGLLAAGCCFVGGGRRGGAGKGAGFLLLCARWSLGAGDAAQGAGKSRPRPWGEQG
jgi:hypothetical protein